MEFTSKPLVLLHLGFVEDAVVELVACVTSNLPTLERLITLRLSESCSILVSIRVSLKLRSKGSEFVMIRGYRMKISYSARLFGRFLLGDGRSLLSVFAFFTGVCRSVFLSSGSTAAIFPCN